MLAISDSYTSTRGATRANPKYTPVGQSERAAPKSDDGKFAVGKPSLRLPRPKPDATLPRTLRTFGRADPSDDTGAGDTVEQDMKARVFCRTVLLGTKRACWLLSKSRK